MGWASYIRTAPKPTLDASHSIMKGLKKSGNHKIRGCVTDFFNSLKANSAYLDQIKEPCFNNMVNGATIEP